MPIIISEKVLAYKNGFAVRFQKLKDDYTPFCIQYCGNGHYFKTIPEANAYLRSRWGLEA